MKNKIYVILGPTCSGKTSLSLNICKELNGEIISADSRQIYKFMDVGTGKVSVGGRNSAEKVKRCDSVWNINGINVWGYDLITPDKYFSSFDFGVFALPKIAEILSKDKKVFITGGTGFYIDTLTGRVKPSFVEPNFELRQNLSGLSADELGEKLKILDRCAYDKIDKKNTVRLVRAIEKSLVKASMRNTAVEKTLQYIKNVEFIHIGLRASREYLYKRADSWVENIWKDGLIGETEGLINMGYKDSSKMNGLIYKTVLEFLEGILSAEKAIERIKFDMHSYIRRQQTYFKKNNDVVWFDIDKESFKENIYNFINHG